MPTILGVNFGGGGGLKSWKTRPKNMREKFAEFESQLPFSFRKGFNLFPLLTRLAFEIGFAKSDRNELIQIEVILKSPSF